MIRYPLLAAVAMLLSGCISEAVPKFDRYWVNNDKQQISGSTTTVDAICRLGDWAVSGGCVSTNPANTIYADYPATFLGLDGWRCQSTNTVDGKLQARVECLHITNM